MRIIQERTRKMLPERYIRFDINRFKDMDCAPIYMAYEHLVWAATSARDEKRFVKARAFARTCRELITAYSYKGE